MDRIIERCAGLDVHKDSITACVRVPGEQGARRQEIRTFGTTTQQLLALRDWLASFGITLVGMESTGVYWKPVYYVLEDDLECWLPSAHHLRAVPGRKTDVKDAQWICQLIEHGLVRASFVPPRPIRELRDLTRYRKALINERTREVQRLDKVLQDAGIKLSSVATEVLGRSGRAMLEALVSGTHDPAVLADLAQGRLRQKLPQLREALEGRFRAHHALILGELLGHIDYLDEAVARLSEEVERRIAPFREEVALLDTIVGVDRRAAECLLAEIGADMSRFPSHRHLASWAGRCPGNDESAGKHRSGRTRKGSKWLGATFNQCANAAARSKGTYLSSQYARLKGRRGHKKAIGAVRIRSSSSPTSFWRAAAPTATSGRTTSCCATTRRRTRTGWCDSSSVSTTRSRSSRWPKLREPSRRGARTRSASSTFSGQGRREEKRPSDEHIDERRAGPTGRRVR